MRKLLWLGLLLSGCGGDQPSAPGTPWTGLAAGLRGVTSAEAWRINGGDLIPTAEESRPGGKPRERKDFIFFDETSGPVPVPDSARKDLIRLLGDPGIIGDGVHPCMPSPGVKVRFLRPPAAPVTVLFCFECHEIFVYEGPTRREHKGFDNGVDPLAAVMKKVFPADPVIQSLK